MSGLTKVFVLIVEQISLAGWMSYLKNFSIRSGNIVFKKYLFTGVYPTHRASGMFSVSLYGAYLDQRVNENMQK